MELARCHESILNATNKKAPAIVSQIDPWPSMYECTGLLAHLCLEYLLLSSLIVVFARRRAATTEYHYFDIVFSSRV